jgi:ABC-2 type transport system permease protein
MCGRYTTESERVDVNMFAQLLQRLRPTVNPLLIHELRSRMRNQRAYAILTVYMSVLSGIVVLVYIVASAAGNNGVNDSSRVGTALFYLIIGMQVILVSFVTPSFTATALSSEHENNTFDLLRLSLLTARQITYSKLVSAIGYTLLLIFASLPMLSLALLLGGVEAAQILAALLVIVLAGVLFACVGLWVSARVKTSAGALIVTYAITLGIVIGMSVMTLVALPLVNDALYGTSAIVRTNPALASLVQIVLVLLMSTSPISALVATETNLAESGHLLNISINPIPGTTTPIIFPAPFIILALIYVVVSVLLIASTIRQLNYMDHTE